MIKTFFSDREKHRYYNGRIGEIVEISESRVCVLCAGDAEGIEVSEEEINKYKSRAGKLHVSNTIKVLFVKFWFAAALCYFFIWGLSNYLKDQLDLLFVSP